MVSDPDRERAVSAAKLSSTFRLECFLLGFFVACWLAFFVSAAFDYPFAGVVPLGLYELYGAAVLAGWIIGNVFVHRSRGWSRSVRTRLLMVFLLSPGGLFYLLWSLSSDGDRAAVPFAPLYAFAMSFLFLLVPVSFRRSFRRNSIGRR
jgi:hypothetical protein